MRTSESIKNIAKAMAQFQAEVKNPANTADNPFFKSKYAPLNDVLNLVRPILTKHGLSVLQSPSGDGEHITVTTLITHESGEWIESDPLTLKAEKANAQGVGSAVTYARRYALSAMLGISSEDDDDGNYASSAKDKQNEQTDAQTSKTEEKATKEQLNKIYVEANRLGLSADIMKELIADRYKKSSSKELTKTEASDLIEFLTKDRSA